MTKQLAGVGHHHRTQRETLDPREVVRVARVEREAIGDRRGRDQRVERPGGRLPAGPRSDDATWPNARAAAASNGRGSKSASACWT